VEAKLHVEQQSEHMAKEEVEVKVKVKEAEVEE
jgi:hypothetical protein